MEPIATELSNFTYRGNSSDVIDLPCEVHLDGDGNQQIVASVWEPSDEEREAIREGANIKLFMFSSTPISPVWMETTLEEKL